METKVLAADCYVAECYGATLSTILGKFEPFKNISIS